MPVTKKRNIVLEFIKEFSGRVGMVSDPYLLVDQANWLAEELLKIPHTGKGGKCLSKKIKT